MTRVTRSAEKIPTTVPTAPPRRPLISARRSRNSANRSNNAAKNPQPAAVMLVNPNGRHTVASAAIEITKTARAVHSPTLPPASRRGPEMFFFNADRLGDDDDEESATSLSFRLITTSQHYEPLQNRTAKPPKGRRYISAGK